MEGMVIFLLGTVRSLTTDSARPRMKRRKFRLKTRNGLFSVAMEEGPPVENGEEVVVIGRPRLYYHQRHKTHKLVVEAKLVAHTGGVDRALIARLPVMLLEAIFGPNQVDSRNLFLLEEVAR
jgi:hypothetical protein